MSFIVCHMCFQTIGFIKCRFDFGPQRWLICLNRQQVISPLIRDSLSNCCVCRYRINGNNRAFQSALSTQPGKKYPS